jgi:hypothetical protein
MYALRSYGPAAAQASLASYDPDRHDRAKRDITANPSALSRLPVSDAVEAIVRLNDVEALARLLRCRQPRIKVLQALYSHHLYNRAVDSVLAADHPWDGLSIDDVLYRYAHAAPQRLPCGSEIGTAILLSAWLRTRPAALRAAYYRQVLLHMPGPPLMAALLDVQLGHVPGLSADQLPWVSPGPPTRSGDPMVGDTSAYQNELTRFGHCDMALAQCIVRHSLNVPTSMSTYDADALLLLAGSDHQAASIFVRRLLPIGAHEALITSLRADVQARIIGTSDTPQLLAHLIPSLIGKLASASPLGHLLERHRFEDLDVRWALLRRSSPSSLVAYLSGVTPNPVDVDHVHEVLESMHTDPALWSSSLASLVSALDLRYDTHTAAVCAGYLVEHLHDCATLLSRDGMVGRHAVAEARDRLGDSEAAWDLLVRLAKEWTGSYPDLLGVCASIAAPERR